MDITNYTLGTPKFQALIREIADEQHLISRKRKVKDPEVLMTMVCMLAAFQTGLRQLTVLAYTCFGIQITERALRKWLAKSTQWLSMVINRMLQSRANSRELSSGAHFRRVFAVDASSMQQVGKENNEYRIHTCFELCQNTIHEVVVTDKHVAESFYHFDIIADSLYLADAGYSRASQYFHIVENNGEAILRITPSHVCVFDSQGEQIDLCQLLVDNSDKELFELECFIRAKDRQLPIRLVLSHLPEEKRAAAIERKRQISRRKQMQIRPQTVVYAEWMVLGTSLGSAEYSSKKIVELYRLRWQVELLFKNLKQHLAITKIKKCGKSYATTLIYGWIILWLHIENQTYQTIQAYQKEGGDMEKVSVYQISGYFVNHARFGLMFNFKPNSINPTELVTLLARRDKKHPNQYVDSFRLVYS